MTRKDFNAIAAAFKQAAVEIQTSSLIEDKLEANLGHTLAMVQVMTVLAASNPNFDRQRFITATLP